MAAPRRLAIEADGGSRGNPGPAGYGAVVTDADTGAVLAERAAGLGTATNNVAEYRGLIAGLEAALEIDPEASLEVRMDSKLVIEQMAGRWQVKHPAMRPLAVEAAGLVRSFGGGVRWTWIPRERNKAADRLANAAMDAQAEGRQWEAAGAAEPVSVAVPAFARPPDTSPTRLLVVRHGQTEHTVQKRFSGRSDPPLNERGEQQAAAVARRILTLQGESTSGENIAAVISSPLTRARQTAATVATALGLEATVEDRLRECDFGDWDGATFAEIAERSPAALAAWFGSPATAPPGGESVLKVRHRVGAALDDLRAAWAGRTIVVVSHVTPVKCLAVLAGGFGDAALFRLHIDLCSVSTFEWFADGPTLVRGLNDVGHLGALLG